MSKMKFFNVRSFNGTNNQLTTSTNTTPPVMSFSHRYLHYKHQQDLLKNKEVETSPIAVEPPNKPKPMMWGEPTWFLFHTLAQKVKEEYFDLLKNDLFTKIISICSNLPCPTCADHAAAYMSKVNFSAIKTKKDLIDMLFNFHNIVNSQKKYPIFPYSELEPKYTSAVTINIIQNFILHFDTKVYNVQLMANSMRKSRLVSSLKEWFNANIQYFDP